MSASPTNTSPLRKRIILGVAAVVFGLACVALVVTWRGTAYSGSYEDAAAAYYRRDFKTARKLMQPLAEQGNAEAQLRLGLMYRYSDYGVPNDKAKGLRWIRRAAEQSQAAAQFHLGQHYYDVEQHDYVLAEQWFIRAAEQGISQAAGRLADMYEAGYFPGIPKDVRKAAKYRHLEAEQGDPFAQFSLGSMYLEGDGVPRDCALAAAWFRRAAAKGLSNAQHALGELYSDGHGVPQDYVLAHMWLNLAGTRTDTYGRRFRAAREGVEAKMTPEQIAEAQKLARRWEREQSVAVCRGWRAIGLAETCEE